LSAVDVANLARLVGVVVPDDDLTEVGLRLSVAISGVERIDDPAVETVDPDPVPREND
jgi:hypothetical protein